MSIYILSKDDIEFNLFSNIAYSKGIDNKIEKIINSNFCDTKVYAEDLGNVIIIKRYIKPLYDFEINFFGDGCYLNCIYMRQSTTKLFHKVKELKEFDFKTKDKFSLFTGHFHRSMSSKVLFQSNNCYEIIHIIVKKPLIKQMAEIDGKHSKLFELEYQGKCDISILLNEIYSPTAILIIEQILNCKYQGQLRAKYIEMKSIELILHLMSLSFSNIKYETKNTIAERAMIYIENSYNKNIKIEDIAKHLMVSKANLKLKFREKFNINITDMINKLRMMEVQKLIELGYTFAEIADLLQYKNQTNLKNRYFEWCKKNISNFSN